MQKKIFLMMIIFFSVSCCLLAQSGGTGANFLKMPVGSRPMGLGSTFTGVGDNIYTLYWNPAGIGFIRRWEISAMYNQYFADMYYGAISGLKQYELLGSRKTAVGLGLFFHGMPEWSDATGTEQATANNVMALAAFGQRLDWLSKKLSVGLNVKFARSVLANYDAFTFATDVGILSRWNLFDHPFMIGAAVQNIGFQTAFINEKSPIPLGYRFGVSYRFLDCDYHHLLLAMDLAKYKYGNFKVGLGAEYWFWNMIAVRSGYTFNQDDMGDFSFGVSAKLDAFNSGWQTDYAQSDFGDALGYTRSGAVSIFTVSPEPFYLLAPKNGQVFGPDEKVKLHWEPAEDPDFCDVIGYRNLVDPDSMQLKQAAKTISKDATAKSQLFSDLPVADTTIRLANLPPGTYYWNVIAIDRKGHTQLATAVDYKNCSRGSKEIRWFIKGAPDLKVRELAFQPTSILPDLNDSTQGAIRYTVENIGNWTAYKFKVALSQSYDCEGSVHLVKEVFIDSLKPRQVIPMSVSWTTNKIGRHRFVLIIDPENQVFESNETNNQDSCIAITVPRGRVVAAKDLLVTRKIVLTYCEIPIVPIVFFEEKSAVVDDDFFREDVIKPQPILKVIAQRLIDHPNFKIQLAGYFDPISEPGARQLATERMQQVYAIMVDSLKVPSGQIGFHEDEVSRRRLERAPEPMVNAENRRVEIFFDSNKPDERFELFGPLETKVTPQISDGLVFHSQLKAFVDVTCWQLLIQDEARSQTVYRTPFRIDPITNPIDMIDSTVWIGRDNENKLVPLNQNYYYIIKVQDRLGREFTTVPQKFYLKCNWVEDQLVQVHLNEFDSPKEFFDFNEQRIDTLIKRLCESTSMKAKFNGYACDIGGFDYNVNLAHHRAATYFEQFKSKLQQQCPSARWETQLIPILTPQQLKQKYAGHPGSYADPIKYFNPCTVKEYVFPMDNPYGRMLSRRVDIILFQEKPLSSAEK